MHWHHDDVMYHLGASGTAARMDGDRCHCLALVLTKNTAHNGAQMHMGAQHSMRRRSDIKQGSLWEQGGVYHSYRQSQ